MRRDGRSPDEALLRRIVVDNTVVGGHPRTDGIARQAYAAGHDAASSAHGTVMAKIEAEARRRADLHPKASDGRNALVMFADWVAARAVRPQGTGVTAADDGMATPLENGASPTTGDGSGPEALRRARIVKRYVEIDLPSATDDRRFAEELGLSVDSLLRLAAAWRLHGDAAYLQGARAGADAADREAAKALAPSQVDMGAIPPDRTAETLRRIGVIHRHLQIADPSIADRSAAAAEFGVLPVRFARIVRAWMLHRDPRVIPGATAPRRKWRKDTSRRERLQGLLDEVLASLGSGATVAAAIPIMEARCAAEGLAMPSPSTLYEWRKGTPTG